MAVGETLARAREARGLSVEDVSNATRIRGGLIRSIEADDFSGCGGSVYARGHIRAIARAVGIDPEVPIAEFDALHSEDPAPALVPVPAVDPDAAARADRKQPNWAAAMAVALVVICVLAGVSLLGNRHSPSPAAHQKPGPVLPTPTNPVVSQPASPPPSAQAALPAGALALIRVTSSRTWLKVTTFSGRVLYEGLLSAGQQKIFRDAKGLRLTIGNAPVVDLVADGRDVGAPRSTGNVAHVTIEPGGTVQYA